MREEGADQHKNRDRALKNADIDAAVAQYLLDREPFVSGVTIPPKTDLLTKSGLTGVVEDIVTAANGFMTDVSFKLSASGGNLFFYTLSPGEKAKLTSSVSFPP